MAPTSDPSTMRPTVGEPQESFGDEGPETDGRRLRRSRNRDAAVDALLSLYREGNLDPSAAEIAEHAGLSPRSLFRYFDDVDDLVRSAIDRQAQLILPLAQRMVAADLPNADRIAAFVDLRLELFAAMGRVGRVARLRAPFRPEIATYLRAMRAFLRQQVEDTFASELDRLDASHRLSTLAAIDVVCSYDAWDLLTDDQHLSAGDTRDTLTRSVAALLNTDH